MGNLSRRCTDRMRRHPHFTHGFSQTVLHGLHGLQQLTNFIMKMAIKLIGQVAIGNLIGRFHNGS